MLSNALASWDFYLTSADKSKDTKKPRKPGAFLLDAVGILASLSIYTHSVALFDKHRYLYLSSCLELHNLCGALGGIALNCWMRLCNLQINLDRKLEADKLAIL